MKKIFSVLILFLAFTSAHADVTLTPIAFDMTANGVEAQGAFAAMKAAGITPNPNGGFNVSTIAINVNLNTALDSTDPCFNHPAYSASFNDDNKIQKINGVASSTPVNFYNPDTAKNCGNDPTAQSLATAWTLLAGRKIPDPDTGMGQSNFSASNISCTFLTYNSQYFCNGTVGN